MRFLGLSDPAIGFILGISKQRVGVVLGSRKGSDAERYQIERRKEIVRAGMAAGKSLMQIARENDLSYSTTVRFYNRHLK